MTTIIELDDLGTIALAKVLASISRTKAHAPLTDDTEHAAYVRARRSIDNAATELINEERSGRRWYNLSPDCVSGKHPACHGDAWNHKEDAAAACDCECHAGAVG